MIVVNSGYRLLIDTVRGTIASFQSTYGVNRELLIRDHVRLPLFNVEFMNDRAEFKLVASSEAKKITVRKDEQAKDQTVTIEYKEIGELPVDAIVTIRCPSSEALTYWNLELKNGTKSWIGHVQFPVIEAPFTTRRMAIQATFCRPRWMVRWRVQLSLQCINGPNGPVIPRSSVSGEEQETSRLNCGWKISGQADSGIRPTSGAIRTIPVYGLPLS